MKLISTAPEFCDDILGKKFGIASGNIDIYVFYPGYVFLKSAC